MISSKIKVAIVGIWNCASSLIQGIEYYKNKGKTEDGEVIGLINNVIGEYSIDDIEIAAAIDVNINKIWRTISDAIFVSPNNTIIFFESNSFHNRVIAWPVMDGISERMNTYIPLHSIQKTENEWKQMIVDELLEKEVDILISYLPVGAKQASRFYAECAIMAKVAFANAIPEFICSTTERSEKFREAWVPCAWDDIKSQFWATILHRTIVDLIQKRGLKIDSTYQLNIGWNSDFHNMKDDDRLESKRISKTEAVTSMAGYSFPVKIWPSDYIPHLQDNKICYINLKWKQFWDVSFELDLKLSVEDSPNSAGVMVDVIRLLKLSIDRGLSGYQDFSSYYFKHPAQQLSEDLSYQIVKNFISYKSTTEE